MNADKNALEVFVIVAQTRNFRLAAEQLGVTRPAISQSLRRLEDRLNITLMQRTTRSVQLTEAGQRLYAEVAPAINQLNRAVTDIAELAAEPRGQLRLAISSIAERMLGENYWRALLPLTRRLSWKSPSPMRSLILSGRAMTRACGWGR